MNENTPGFLVQTKVVAALRASECRYNPHRLVWSFASLLCCLENGSSRFRMSFRSFQAPPWRVLNVHPGWWLLVVALVGLGSSVLVGFVQSDRDQSLQTEAFREAVVTNAQSLMGDFRTIKQDAGTLRATLEGTMAYTGRLPTRVLPLETGGRLVHQLGDQRIASVSLAHAVDRVHTDLIEAEIEQTYPAERGAGLGAVIEDRGILPMRDVDFGRERYEGDRRAVITTLWNYNASTNPLIAFDLTTSPTRRHALETAARRRQISLTEPILLVTTAGPFNGFLLVDPIFNSKPSPRAGGVTETQDRSQLNWSTVVPISSEATAAAATAQIAASTECGKIFQDLCASFESPERAMADFNASGGARGSCSS